MPSNDQGGAQPRPGRYTERARSYDQRCRDRRLHDKMWVPRYLWRYVDRIGTNGLALYWALAWHCTGEAPERWPSMRQLGELLRLSRSTIERTFRALRDVGLIETASCISPQGQRSNYWDLTDPPAEREQAGSHGTPLAGAVRDDGGAPSQATAPPATDDGGAPSLVTAPSLQNGFCNEGESLAAARPLSPPVPPSQIGDEIERLSAHWFAQVADRRQAVLEAHRAEIGPAVRQLLRWGWTEEQLRASMDEAERDQFEWPREWRERVGRPKRVPKRPSQPVQTPPVAPGASGTLAAVDQALIDLFEKRGHHAMAAKLRLQRDQAAAAALRDQDAPRAAAPPLSPPPAAPAE